MEDFASFEANETVTDTMLANVFVPCVTEMMRLMSDSQRRFEHTAVYGKLQRKLSHE